MSAAPPHTPTSGLTGELAGFLRPLLPEGVVVGARLVRLDAPYRQVVLEPVPAGPATPITRWVRLQITAVAITASLQSDWEAAANLFDQACTAITGRLPGRVVSAAIDSGPVRVPDDNENLVAYGVLLLTTC